jgi:hypothetical protein
MAFTDTIKISAQGKRSTTLGAGTKAFDRNFVYKKNLTDGNDVDKAEEFVSIDTTIDTASDETWDLQSNGNGDNDCPGLGGDITFTEIVAIIIKNKSTTAAEILTLGNLSANAFDACFGDLDLGQIEIPPGGCVALVNPTAAGWTVDGTHYLLQLSAASGSAVPFEMKIVGRTT